jgi:hypothetical protein
MLVLYAQKKCLPPNNNTSTTHKVLKNLKKIQSKIQRGEQNCKTSMQHTNLKKKRKTSMKRAKPQAQLKKLASR